MKNYLTVRQLCNGNSILYPWIPVNCWITLRIHHNRWRGLCREPGRGTLFYGNRSCVIKKLTSPLSIGTPNRSRTLVNEWRITEEEPWLVTVPKPQVDLQRWISHIAPLSHRRRYFQNWSDSIEPSTRGTGREYKTDFPYSHRTLTFLPGGGAISSSAVDLAQSHRTVVIWRRCARVKQGTVHALIGPLTVEVGSRTKILLQSYLFKQCVGLYWVWRFKHWL